jgi:hypothetical protein
MSERAFLKWAAHRPRKGQPVTYCGEVVGTVRAVEGNLCWVDGSPHLYGDAPFIWAHHDALNSLHRLADQGAGR